MTALPTASEAADRRRVGLDLMRSERPGVGRLEVLSTFNVDLLPPLLVEAYHRAGLAVDVRVGPFGQLSQAILDPTSALYETDTDEVLLVPAPEDLLAPLFASTPSALSPEDAAALVDERLSELDGLVRTLLDRLASAVCTVVVFGTDRAAVGHVLDPHAPERRQLLLERFTGGLRRMSAVSPRVVVVDWDWHVRGSGWDAARDERLWYLGRMRLGQAGLAGLADLVAVHAAAYRGPARKVVALDLDGLLWGGVVGESGLSGIEIGEDGIGLAFQDFQRELLKLHDTGVLLVACSKNNPEDAFEVFDRHPGMVLRRDHLAGERVNWQDKATNLRELAEELNLGLDSFVFLDDSPVERDWVRRACPEVAVPEIPEDPSERPSLIREAAWFARLATTDADRRRTASYREEKERHGLRRSTASFEDFLVSLEQTALIESVHDGSLARAAQLCQRTNQFNLTTKRYTLADLEQLAADSDCELFTLAVSDRFGESGITGLAILRHGRSQTVVDTLLISCRVLGRRIEDAFLSFLCERAVARGSSELVGLFEPTAKNAQVADFYALRGFVPSGDGAFRYDLDRGVPPAPPEITVEVRSLA